MDAGTGTDTTPGDATATGQDDFPDYPDAIPRRRRVRTKKRSGTQCIACGQYSKSRNSKRHFEAIHRPDDPTDEEINQKMYITIDKPYKNCPDWAMPEQRFFDTWKCYCHEWLFGPAVVNPAPGEDPPDDPPSDDDNDGHNDGHNDGRKKKKKPHGKKEDIHDVADKEHMSDRSTTSEEEVDRPARPPSAHDGIPASPSCLDLYRRMNRWEHDSDQDFEPPMDEDGNVIVPSVSDSGSSNESVVGDRFEVKIRDVPPEEYPPSDYEFEPVSAEEEEADDGDEDDNGDDNDDDNDDNDDNDGDDQAIPENEQMEVDEREEGSDEEAEDDNDDNDDKSSNKRKQNKNDSDDDDANDGQLQIQEDATEDGHEMEKEISGDDEEEEEPDGNDGNDGCKDAKENVGGDDSESSSDDDIRADPNRPFHFSDGSIKEGYDNAIAHLMKPRSSQSQ